MFPPQVVAYMSYASSLLCPCKKKKRFGEDVVVDHWSSLMMYDFQGCRNQNLTLDQREEKKHRLCVHDTVHKILFKILCLYINI